MSQPLRRRQVLVFGMLATGIVTLLLPATRETQWLTVRLLLHLPAARTAVHGQPNGCVVYAIPTTHFTDEIPSAWHADAATSPDAFLLATRPGRGVGNFPDAAAWSEHPLQEWGAIAAAAEVLHGLDDDPHQVSVTDRALAVVQRAQIEHPANGALWLAESLVQHKRGDFQAALRALQGAAQRPQWDAQTGPAWTHARSALEAQGLPAFDAACQAREVTYVWRHLFRNKSFLVEQMAQAVQHGDNMALCTLLKLAEELAQASWRHVQPPIRGGLMVRCTDDLYNEMALRLCRRVPQLDRATYDVRDAVQKKVLGLYFTTFVDAAHAQRAERLLETQQEELEAYREAEYWCSTRFLTGWFAASAAGAACLVLLAGVLALFVVESPYALDSRRFLGDPRRYCARFWILSGVATAAACALFFSALHAIHQRVGIGCEPHRFTALQENLALAIGLGVLTFVLRRVLVRQRALLTAARWCMFGLYVVVIVLATCLRANTVQTCPALIGM